MKRTTKTVLSTILAVATIFSASPVFASSAAPKDLAPDTGIITPFAVRYPVINELVVGNPGATRTFNVDANYGWVKVWVKNNGQDTITVTVTQGTESGPQKMQFQLAPGAHDFRVASDPFSTGNHVVSLSPAQGYTVNAELTVKTATTVADL